MFIKHLFVELSVNKLKHFKNPLRPSNTQVTDFIDCDGQSEEFSLNPVFSGKVSSIKSTTMESWASAVPC